MKDILIQIAALIEQAKNQPDKYLVSRVNAHGTVWKIIIQHTPSGVDIRIKNRGKVNNGTEN